MTRTSLAVLLLAACFTASGCRTYSHDFDPAYQSWFEARKDGAVHRNAHSEITTPSGQRLALEPNGWASSVALKIQDTAGGRTILLPDSPERGTAYASIIGTLDETHVAVMMRYSAPGRSWTPPENEEDRGAVVVCDLKSGRVTSSVKSLHDHEPHVSLGRGEIWISKQDTSSSHRPDHGTWTVGGHPGSRQNAVQTLFRLSADGDLQPTGATLVCQPNQLWVDHIRRLIYSTDAQGVTLEERSVDGSLLRSWRKPAKISQIEFVMPGFDERPVRIIGVGRFSGWLATSRHVYAFDPANGEWSWLGTYSQTMPMMNI